MSDLGQNCLQSLLADDKFTPGENELMIFLKLLNFYMYMCIWIVSFLNLLELMFFELSYQFQN